MSERLRTALVTGANRGMGLETCRQLARLGYRVVLTARDAAKGSAAAGRLAGQGLPVEFRRLDVTDPDSIREVQQSLAADLGGVDVLVNNAAVYQDEGISVMDVDLAMARATLEANLLGPWALCQAFIPGMLQRGYGRVVNVSSSAGQSSMAEDYAPSYSASKAGLNTLTRMLADAVRGSNVLVNAVCPGWVRTEMGGPAAPRSVEEGTDTIVWLATLPDGGPSGGFFRDRKPIPW